jgi:hypothetical protein
MHTVSASTSTAPNHVDADYLNTRYGRAMAVIVRMIIESASQEDHDRLGAAVEARLHDRGGPPDGLMVHLGWPVDDGFVIAEAWRTPELFDGYRRELLAPALREAGLVASQPDISPAWSIARP